VKRFHHVVQEVEGPMVMQTEDKFIRSKCAIKRVKETYCVICSEKFSTSNLLTSHYKTFHPSYAKNFLDMGSPKDEKPADEMPDDVEEVPDDADEMPDDVDEMPDDAEDMPDDAEEMPDDVDEMPDDNVDEIPDEDYDTMSDDEMLDDETPDDEMLSDGMPGYEIRANEASKNEMSHGKTRGIKMPKEMKLFRGNNLTEVEKPNGKKSTDEVPTGEKSVGQMSLKFVCNLCFDEFPTETDVRDHHVGFHRIKFPLDVNLFTEKIVEVSKTHKNFDHDDR
jgi:hypothetical protein